MKKILTIMIAMMVVFTAMPMFSGMEVSAASKPGKVKGIKVAKATSTQAVIKWKKAKNAKKYQVYVKNGSAAFKKAKTTSEKKYTLKLKAGVTYKVKVRATNGNAKGKFSKSVKVRTAQGSYSNPQMITSKDANSIQIGDVVAFTLPNGERSIPAKVTDTLKLDDGLMLLKICTPYSTKPSNNSEIWLYPNGEIFFSIIPDGVTKHVALNGFGGGYVDAYIFDKSSISACWRHTQAGNTPIAPVFGQPEVREDVWDHDTNAGYDGMTLNIAYGGTIKGVCKDKVYTRDGDLLQGKLGGCELPDAPANFGCVSLRKSGEYNWVRFYDGDKLIGERFSSAR